MQNIIPIFEMHYMYLINNEEIIFLFSVLYN